MFEFRKKLSQEEIRSGSINWEAEHEDSFRLLFPAEASASVLYEGKPLPKVKLDWAKKELYLGEPLTGAPLNSEVVLQASPGNRSCSVQCRIQAPPQRMMVKKRLSLNEYHHRYLKWYAREDELYRRLFPSDEPFIIEIGNRRITGRQPDFEKRRLVVGEILRCFSPGDDLLIAWASDSETPVLVITREEHPENVVEEALTSTRGLVTRLISRPLSDFNDGEVKALIALLVENKSLWEKIVTISEENRCLKEQVGTLESLFDQFVRNTFFVCKKDFEEWVISHLNLVEKGLRVLHRDYVLKLENNRPFRIEILCQDRKGVLVMLEVVFNPQAADIDAVVRQFAHLRANITSLGCELTGKILQANSIRAIFVSNVEKPELVEQCIQNGIKLCVITGGCVIDVIE